MNKQFLRFTVTAILLMIFNQFSAYSQNWQWQNPEPTANFLWGITESAPGVWWTGGEMGSLFRSSDDGFTWQQVFFNSGNRTINDLFFVSSSAGYLAAGFGGNGNTSSKIYKTVNGGETWTVTADIQADLKRIKFLNPERGFALAAGGLLLKTTDGGFTWSDISPSGGTALDFHFTSEMKGVAVGDGGFIARTTDGGVSWITLTNVPFEAYLSVDFTSEQTGYISGWSGKLFKTTNGGLNWSTYETGLFYNLVSIDFANADTGYAVGDFGIIFRTTNAGASWQQDNSADLNISEYHYRVKASSGGKVISVGAFGLINRRDNSGWSFINRYKSPNITSVYFTTDSKGYVVDNEGGIYSTQNGGIDWERHQVIYFEQTFLEEIIFNTPQSGFIFGPYDTMLITSDAGNSWHKTPMPAGSFGIRAAHFPSQSTGYAVGYSGTVIKTTNSGASWFRMNSGILNNIDDVYFLTNTTGFAGSFYDGLLKTTNGGITWVSVPGISTPITAITFISSSTGLATGGVYGTYKTTDGGATWSATSSTPPLGAEDIVFKDENNGYIGTSRIFVTTDGGESWTADETGFGTLDLGLLAFAKSPGGDIYASGLRSSIIKLRSSPALGVPVLISPSNNSTAISLRPKFSWAGSPGTVSYEIQIAETEFFEVPVFFATGLTTDTIRPAAGVLLPDRQYYWRVRAKAGSLTSSWSAVFNFTTDFAPFTFSSAQDTTFAGDTLTISYSAGNPSEAPVTSLRVKIADFRSFMRYHGFDTTGTITGAAGWTFTINNSGDTLHISGTGEPLTSGGEFFKLKFIINNVPSGSYPYSALEIVPGEGGFNTTIAISPVVIFPYMPGDVDLNGYVQAFDAAEILKYLADMISLNLLQKRNASVTSDNLITALDASVILRYVVGLIPVLPHNETSPGEATPLTGGFTTTDNRIIIPFSMMNISGLYGFEVSVLYDTTSLRFIGVETSGSFMSGHTISRNKNEKIRIVSAFVEPVNNSGQEEILKLIFEPASGFTGSSDVRFSDFRINENVFLADAGAVTINLPSDIRNEALVPVEYSLSQNFPNPFNPETLIRFGLPEPSFLKLEIYDISGSLIRTAAEGFFSAGFHSISFEGSDLPSGVYLYRLKAGNNEFVKKMNLIK